jgi:type I restriction enzyme, S subunit
VSELPSGWTQAKIAELIAVDGLFSDGDWVESKDQDPRGSIRLLQLADIGDGKFLNKSNRFVNEIKFVDLRCTEVLEGDVLVARMPDPLGRACLLPKMQQRCITVVDVALLRPGSASVVPTWLMHIINAPEVRGTIELLSSGTTRRRISRNNLSQIELPIPPFNEQKRISDKLDQLLAAVDSCKSRLDTIPGIIKRFRQSVLAAATSGELTADWREAKQPLQTSPYQGRLQVKSLPPVKGGLRGVGFKSVKNPCEWSEVVLEDVTDKITDGEHLTPIRSSSGRYLLSARNVLNGRIDLQNVDYVDESEFERIRKRCNPMIGDVLLSCSGSVGRAALVDADDCYVMVRSAAMIRPIQDNLLPSFLMYGLQSPAMQLQILEKSSATAQSNIFLGSIKSLELSLPSIPEQQEIVRRVEALFAVANRLEARYQAARAQVDQLTPSLLAKAFRGELVPQDPNDEPAEKLLERIRSAQAKSGTVKSVKRQPKSPNHK